MTESYNNTDLIQLEKIPHWDLVEESWIKRIFEFKDFVVAMEFVNGIARYAEKENHHPFISINYNVVTLKLTTLEEKALTVLDIEMAEQFDTFYKEIK